MFRLRGPGHDYRVTPAATTSGRACRALQRARPCRVRGASEAEANQSRAVGATTAALLDAARELFVRHGYAETATPSIVARARITRGALYHHFADKRALFRAVVEDEARAVARHIEDTTRTEQDPLGALLTGSDAYLKP